MKGVNVFFVDSQILRELLSGGAAPRFRVTARAGGFISRVERIYSLTLEFVLRRISSRRKPFRVVGSLAIPGTRYSGMLDWIEIGLKADTSLQRI